MNLLFNIINNYEYLKHDFTGIVFAYPIFFNLLINILVPPIMIMIFYLLGEKIKSIFFKKEHEDIGFFIKIAFGYIFSASVILFLGMIEILYRNVLYVYYAFLVIIAVYPLSTLKSRLRIVFGVYKEYRRQFVKHKMVNVVIIGFVLIGFMRLIPPETGVDALWYHTDYPRLYLKSHSMMNIDPIGKYYPAVVPALSDMLYVVTQSLDLKDSSRFVHFSFYILSVLVYLIVFRKKYNFTHLTALLFATSPTIIKFASSAYAESVWILCWLLAVFIITSKRKLSFGETALTGILIGGALAAKLWMIPFAGVFLIYLALKHIKINKIKLLKLITVFIITSSSIPLLWYLRAFLITGNPLFPTFWSYPNGEFNNPAHLNLDLASMMERVRILSFISPFSIIGFIFLFSSRSKLKELFLKNKSLIIFASILTAAQVLINYNYPRFIIPFYSIAAIILAFGISRFINLSKYFRYLFYFLSASLFLYYFTNSLLTLPYGLGWASENKYLARILSRDNSSYYDYNNQFSKSISGKDVVATYGLWGFYYANFDYVYAEDIFRKEERSLDALRKHEATKLLILGEDIEHLCIAEKLKDCLLIKYKLSTYYKFSSTNSAQYLYELNKNVE